MKRIPVTLLLLFTACGDELALEAESSEVVIDRDGDGFRRALDCDDRDATVYPGAPERFDGVLNDCAGDPAALDDVEVVNASFNLIGQSDADTAGRSVASGDIDCDGIDDLLVDAPYADHDGEIDVGKVYVLYGRRSARRLAGDLALETQADAVIYGSQGFIMVNGATVEVEDAAGTSVAVVGDTNGDGCDDFAIGAPGVANPQEGLFHQPSAGRVYIFRGASTRLSGFIPTSSASATWSADANDALGAFVAPAGDVDGDGLADIAAYAAAYGAGAGYTYTAFDGKVHLIFGSATRTSGAVRSSDGAELCGTTESDCATILAEVGVAGADYFGANLVGGDIDGDGFSDVVIGTVTSRKSYVFYGSATRSAPLYASSAGTIITGAGSSACVGDLDGDARLDLAVGAHTWGTGVLNLAGRVYLLPSSGARWPAAIDVTTSATVSATFTGAGNDNAGQAIACDKDVDGDGDDELLIGAPFYSADEGYAYLVLGGAPTGDTALRTSTEVASVHGATQFGQAGSAVALGDLDGDGHADLIVGSIELQGLSADGPGRVSVLRGF